MIALLNAIGEAMNEHPIMSSILLIAFFTWVASWLFLPQKVAAIHRELEEIKDLLREKR